MLHLLNHTVAKSMMFFLSGRILDRYRTTELGGVSGLLVTMPVTGGLFAAGMIALIGLPPFGLFLSKFALLRAGFAAGRPWLMAAVLGVPGRRLRLAGQPSQPHALRTAARRRRRGRERGARAWCRSACAP